MINVWQGIRKRFGTSAINEHNATPSSILTTGTFQDGLSYCLQLLSFHPAGSVLYLLDCLCPSDLVVLDLCRLDLDQAHQHKQFPEKNLHFVPNAHEELLADLRAYTRIVPAKEYGHFWLELTKSWLLTCPIDLEYYREDETGKELFCQKLRSELIDRILKLC